MNDLKPKRRWYQFSLKTLLVVMLLSCFVFAWIGSRMKQARENRARVAAVAETTKTAVAAIEELGGTVTSSHEKLRRQTWLEEHFDDPGGPDDPVGVLKVARVDLRYTKVTDADLEPLRELTNLQFLILRATKVTGLGLEHLKGLTNLQELDLQSTSVTDAGLEHLKGLTELQRLWLKGTNVTAEGVKKLQQALPNCEIER